MQSERNKQIGGDVKQKGLQKKRERKYTEDWTERERQIN